MSSFYDNENNWNWYVDQALLMDELAEVKKRHMFGIERGPLFEGLGQEGKEILWKFLEELCQDFKKDW